MPFPHPMRPYTRDVILVLGGNQNGVYGIFKGSIAIYIGSGDIRDRMLAHLNGDNTCIILSGPDRWTAELFSGDPKKREGELIQEYRPECNKVVPQ